MGKGQTSSVPHTSTHPRIPSTSLKTSYVPSFGDPGYQKTCATIIGLCNKLRSMGVSNDIKMPTLVLAGNQSSGKSSVVEGLAGVPLPRNKGTCTRCPTEVRLREAPPTDGDRDAWKCTIKLRIEFDKDHQPLTAILPEEVFHVVTDPRSLGPYVTAAQAVLLNPSRVAGKPASAFAQTLVSPSKVKATADFDLLGKSELDFTKNTVVLDIEGADADLTIVDLPGIVQSHDNRRYIDLIKTLVKHWITPEHTIIVMVITGMDDIENQAIFNLAREVDPDGRRTIGVITKPDAIAAGTHDGWLQLAENQRKPLQLGYYVVKNPNQGELDSADMDHAAARKLEMEFFADEQQPWSKLGAATKQRLNTSNLRCGLSEVLIRGIIQQLPTMHDNTVAALHRIDGELHSLPAPLSADSSFELSILLQQLSHQVAEEVCAQGDGGREFYQVLDRHFIGLKEAMWQAMPCFKVGNEYVTVCSIGWDGGNQAPVDTTLAMTLASVTQLLQRYKGEELPGHMPYSAVKALLTKFKGKWKSAMADCLDDVVGSVRGMIDKQANHTFGRFPKGFPAIRGAVASRLEQCTNTARDRLERLIGMEDRNVFTLNDHYYTDGYNKLLVHLKKCTMGATQTDYVRAAIDKSRPYLEPYVMQSAEDLYRVIPTKHDNELNMMATALSYFKVVFKRVADMVPLHIREYLLTDFCQNLPQTIHSALSHHDSFDASELLAEDDHIKLKRAQLQDLRARLKSACETMEDPLHSLGLHKAG